MVGGDSVIPLMFICVYFNIRRLSPKLNTFTTAMYSYNILNFYFSALALAYVVTEK